MRELVGTLALADEVYNSAWMFTTALRTKGVEKIIAQAHKKDWDVQFYSMSDIVSLVIKNALQLDPTVITNQLRERNGHDLHAIIPA